MYNQDVFWPTSLVAGSTIGGHSIGGMVLVGIVPSTASFPAQTGGFYTHVCMKIFIHIFIFTFMYCIISFFAGQWLFTHMYAWKYLSIFYYFTIFYFYFYYFTFAFFSLPALLLADTYFAKNLQMWHFESKVKL